MFTYLYLGEDEIEVVGYGTVKPLQEISVDHEINHPLFQLKKNKKDK